MLVTCQVFGKRAGKAAAQRARDRGMPFVPPGVIAAEEERLAGMRARRGSLKAEELKRELQECMSRNVLVVRSHESLQVCLAEVERLRSRLVEANTETPTQLVGTLEVENLLTTAEIMARAALLRTESRGSHYRADYPQRDDAHWQQSIVTRLVNGRMEQLPRRLPRLPDAADSAGHRELA
jgi:succinate dehydrogenase/fumarate reductase flavoprotein subunit